MGSYLIRQFMNTIAKLITLLITLNVFIFCTNIHALLATKSLSSENSDICRNASYVTTGSPALIISV